MLDRDYADGLRLASESFFSLKMALVSKVFWVRGYSLGFLRGGADQVTKALACAFVIVLLVYAGIAPRAFVLAHLKIYGALNAKIRTDLYNLEYIEFVTVPLCLIWFFLWFHCTPTFATRIMRLL